VWQQESPQKTSTVVMPTCGPYRPLLAYFKITVWYTQSTVYHLNSGDIFPAGLKKQMDKLCAAFIPVPS
jgi:hypothetical protein